MPLDRQLLAFVTTRRQAGLSEETLCVLVSLVDGLASNKELSVRTGINPTTLPRYTASLVRDGYLAKQTSTEDAREVWFGLSERGRTLVAVLANCFRCPACGK